MDENKENSCETRLAEEQKSELEAAIEARLVQKGFLRKK
jgi:hypothetical protein